MIKLMASNIVKFTTNKSNDWEVLQYEDFQREGHHLDTEDWLDLIKYLGYEVTQEELTDEEMEERY